MPKQTPYHWIAGPATGKDDPDRDVKRKIIAMCEQMEDEADEKEASANGNEHVLGFARGYRKAAKSLRNYAADCFEIAAKLPHYD